MDILTVTGNSNGNGNSNITVQVQNSLSAIKASIFQHIRLMYDYIQLLLIYYYNY